mmetsp:Transcript_17912/g.12894  ORF Transcript_17912/g.12894 Transcript_17912/m.12894 type:complete len:166 (+) Transcript_17912:487-984(+)
MKDQDGKTPLDCAMEQESGVLKKKLLQILGLKVAPPSKRKNSDLSAQEWPAPKVDYELDAEQFMEEAKRKEEEENKDKKFRVPVDSTGKFSASYEVYYDDEGKPWDVYMTKVDLKNGLYGDYVFYKMQLLFDRNLELYVVFTRWGRIGETGMNQRSPFPVLEEAK